jgi:hypothetical protein
MNSSFLQKCLAVLKKEEVQLEIIRFMKPIINLILNEIYPYIYLSILLVFVCFFLILGIFILLLRKQNIESIK